jgi:hypothetical protein
MAVDNLPPPPAPAPAQDGASITADQLNNSKSN